MCHQQDLEERSSQVKRMANIYRKAKSVIVWLGPESPDSSAALNLLREMGSKIKVDWITEGVEPAQDASEADMHWGYDNILLPLNESERNTIYNLVSRPWFERLWIWQEVAFAPPTSIVMCGREVIPWKVFKDASLIYFNKMVKRSAQYKEYAQVIGRHQLVYMLCRPKAFITIAELLHDMRGAKCEDPRDRIFGLLTFLERDQLGIEPDYNKTAIDVYRDTLVRNIDATRSLDLLLDVEYINEDHETRQRPSWVPDWSKPSEKDAWGLKFAGHESKAVAVELRERVLQVTGVSVSEVRQVVTFAGKRVGDFASFEEYVHDSTTLFSDIWKEIYPGESRRSEDIELFLRTIFCGRFTEEDFSPNLSYVTYKEGKDSLMKLLDSEPLKSMPQWTTRDQRFWNLATRFCRGRAIFKSTSGSIGIGPRATLPGDIVAVLLGCHCPVVLRPSSNNHYQIIGEAYYEEVMHGEALLGKLPKGMELVNRYCPLRQNAGHFWAFVNTENGEFHPEDPRWGPLPPGWRRESHDEENLRTLYVNDKTGVTANGVIPHDPRLTPEGLRQGGVDVRTFDLI